MENISILSFCGNEMSLILLEIYITIYCQERTLKLLFGRLEGWAHISIYLRSSNMDCSGEQLWLDSLSVAYGPSTSAHQRLSDICMSSVNGSLSLNQNVRVANIPECNCVLWWSKYKSRSENSLCLIHARWLVIFNNCLIAIKSNHIQWADQNQQLYFSYYNQRIQSLM